MGALLGIFFHAIGGLAAGSFYAPYKKIENWAWEIYWILGGFFSWIVMPWVVSYLVVPDIYAFMNSLSFNDIIWPYFYGVLWGIGGLTFGLTMRYLGMSLGYSIALGLTAAFGTLIPPIYYGQFGRLLSSNYGVVTIIGILLSFIGIAFTGKAGKEKDDTLSDAEKEIHIKEFNFKKGIIVALIAGVLSASFAFGLSAGDSISEKALEWGTIPLFINSPLFIIIMFGGFTTNFIWCLILSIKNRSIKEYVKKEGTPLLRNYLLSIAGGIIWYLQFMFYGMGTTKMGELDFASWSLHMSFIIVFSNMWGIIMKEWKGTSKQIMRQLYYGLIIIIISTFIIGIGNYLQAIE